MKRTIITIATALVIVGGLVYSHWYAYASGMNKCRAEFVAADASGALWATITVLETAQQHPGAIPKENMKFYEATLKSQMFDLESWSIREQERYGLIDQAAHSKKILARAQKLQEKLDAKPN